MGYVLPLLPADARHLGLDDNINGPGRRTLMETEIERIVREHTGPLYSLACPVGKGMDALAAHRLRHSQEQCTEVRTNMHVSPIECAV
jgi:hypothetical protein